MGMVDPTVASRVTQQSACLHPGLGELMEVAPGTELVGRPVPLAPSFQPTDAMIQGAVWPCPLCHVTGLWWGPHRAPGQCCLCWRA